MTAFTEKLDRAAGAATCAVLEIGGASLIGSGVVGLAAGGTGVVPLAAGAAAVMASNFLGCQGWDPNQGEPSPPPGPSLCWEGASTYQIIGLQNGADYGSATPVIKRITAQDVQPAGSGGTNAGLTTVIYSWAKEGGATGTTSVFNGVDDAGNVYTLDQVFTGDPTCEVPSPEQPPIDVPPYEYTDPEDGCELTVNFKGFASGAGGNANPVFKIEPNAATRANTTVIGGCNFEPVIYMGDPNGGPPYVGPWEPDWDTPGQDPYKWKDKLRDIANICSNEDVIQLLNQLLVEPFNGQTYALDAHCEFDADGNPLRVEVPIPSLPPLSAIATRINALIPIQQGQKNFKQPICPPEPVKLEGEFRTIGFISEKTSPFGKSRLRKRLRYRSMSGLGLGNLIDYWKDFEFDAGPVIVQHRGASWGTVKCWAASANEGKRVIRHAAGEAGIDADKVGRWEISGSSSTRLGVSGTMKVNQAGGYYWITARDGSDNRPLVGKT